MYKFIGAAAASCLLSIGAYGRTTPGRAITAEDLVQLRDIGTLLGGRFALSPDGEKIALLLVTPSIRANGYEMTWLIVPTDGGNSPPIQAGTGGDIVLAEIGDGRRNGVLATKKALWSPDGRWFAYLLKHDGAIQIWRSSRDGTVQAQVTHNAADVIDFRWSRDSSKLFFLTGRNRAATAEHNQTEAAQGYLYDRRFWPGYERHPLQYGCTPNWLVQAPAPAGQACPREPMVMSADAAGDEHQAERSEQAEYQNLDVLPALEKTRQIDSIRRAPNHREVAWLENPNPAEFTGYDPPLTVFASHSPDGRHAKRCMADACTGAIDGLWWDANRLIILRSEGHSRLVSALYAWEPDTGKVRAILRTPDYLSECDVVRAHAICLHEGSTAPGTLVSISLRDGTRTTLFDPNPDMQNISFSKVEKLESDDGFGNDAAGHLIYPLDYSAGQRYPLVIVQYRSRGFLRGGVGDEYPIHVFAANGFAVLSFDEPEDRQIAAHASDPAADVTAEYTGFRKQLSHFNALTKMIDELIARGIVDPNRIGITGLSDGAENVAYALIHSSKFAAAAVSTLVFHPFAQRFIGNSGYRDLIVRLFGDPLVSLDKWRELSIGLNADRIYTPLLAQVADHELMEATLNFEPLQDAGRPVEMVVFPNEYHVKWQPAHRLAVYNRNLDWFRFWLQGYEDPAPAKTEQYTRWRELREQQSANPSGKGTPR